MTDKTPNERAEELKAELDSEALKRKVDELNEQLKSTSRTLKEATAKISDEVDRKLGR